LIQLQRRSSRELILHSQGLLMFLDRRGFAPLIEADQPHRGECREGSAAKDKQEKNRQRLKLMF
jgi:hypothetical protein